MVEYGTTAAVTRRDFHWTEQIFCTQFFSRSTNSTASRKRTEVSKGSTKRQLTPDLLSPPSRKSTAQSIEERGSQELVIALVGPVGSGVSTAASFLQEMLTQTFKYDVRPILKLSEIIQSEAHRVGFGSIPVNPRDKYITEMQTAGNRLRETFGGSYLAEKAIEAIYKYRRERGGIAADNTPLPGRRAYILDSLKNLEELSLLRNVYGKTLCVVGVFAPDQLRTVRLLADGASKDSIERIMNRDQGEVATFGQNTRKLFVESDLFICNDRKKDELKARLERFLNIIFDAGIHTPTKAESAMYEAASAAAQSACMSRQVGASIVSANGELIAVGRNDVPRFGGGLYVEDDQSTWDIKKKAIVDRDYRCFRWGGGICHNEMRRRAIVVNIARRVQQGNVLKKKVQLADVIKLLEGTEVDDLTEFSRSIHAEMEAILSVAREGRHSLVGATLYTSTYPCHNCARHIVASGIKRVIYIEPYKKSLAVTLHNDSVTEDPDDEARVVFSQYNGVAPRNYLALFRPQRDRKKEGKVVKQSPAFAVPVLTEPLDARIVYEAKVIADLSEKEQAA
jgi:deoxycytidylate deaminase